MIESVGSAAAATARAAGRYVVTFADEVDEGSRRSALRSVSGVDEVVSTDGVDMRTMDLGEAAAADAVVFARTGVAVVSAPAARMAGLRSSASVLAVRPARVYRVLDAPAVGLADHPTFFDTAQLTWGLQATGVDIATRTGQGVRVAVLDTGLDLTHPDFAGRPVTARSFVTLPGPPGALQGPQDGHGHGTHCTGTAAGPATPPVGRRYGVATEAEIFIGKVLDDEGFGDDTAILAGIEWALEQQCAVVSMSLGASVRAVDPAYEAVGRRALDAGTLIVAAAGNNGNRVFGDPGFVGVPANSPSIMAIAAVDAGLSVAPFSARSQPVDGGQVDLAAPGVAVYSSWPMPRRYNTLQGTSMATPHVAGFAALWAEATGGRGRELWSTLIQQAHRIDQPSADVGAGLARAANP